MKAKLGLVDYDSFVHAWSLDPIGAIVGAPTLAAVEEMLPVALADYLGWLRENGEPVEDCDGWQIVEEIDGRTLTNTGGEFCFDAETAPLSADDLETLIRRMRYTRDDLVQAFAGLPDAVLDWEPPVASQKALDAWAPDARTIRGIARHVLQLELYYRDGLRDGSSRGIFEPVGDPATERAITVDALRSMSDADRARVWHPIRPGRTEPEPWTVRKLARRIITHERGHTAEILQRRTWILLGVPSFG